MAFVHCFADLGVACGVESNTNLHEAANAALERMDLEAGRSRVEPVL